MNAREMLGAAQLRWRALPAREQRLLSLAAALLALLLLWLALAGALQTLRSASAQAHALELQLLQMRQLQAQAQSLQRQPALSREEALAQLRQATTKTLGAGAQLNANGAQVTLVLQGVGSEALAQWLAQARLNARCTPQQARLQRGDKPGSWNGVLVLNLPAAS